MTSKARAVELTKLNIFAVFGEIDVQQRLKNITETWVPSDEVFFVDAMGVFKSHEAISNLVGQIQGLGGPTDEFVELSK